MLRAQLAACSLERVGGRAECPVVALGLSIPDALEPKRQVVQKNADQMSEEVRFSGALIVTQSGQYLRVQHFLISDRCPHQSSELSPRPSGGIRLAAGIHFSRIAARSSSETGFET